MLAIVGENERGAAPDRTPIPQHGEIVVKSKFAEGDYYLNLRKKVDFALQVRTAIGDLLG